MKHLVVLSCENNYFHGWQAKVATYSCLKHQGVAPLIVVHGGVERSLQPDFIDCVDAGAHVARSRNYRSVNGITWAARNTVGTLLDAGVHAKKLGADFVVLMDPDMVWTREVQWPEVLAVDRCPNTITTGRGAEVAEAMGLSLTSDSDNRFGSRVPYVVPTELCEPIGRTWWKVMVEFSKGEFVWADQMRAWALALAVLELEPKRLVLTQTNWKPEAKVAAGLIHYAYEYSHWYKHWFHKPADGDPFNPRRITADCVQGWAHREIVRAAAFFEELERVKCA